jgi:hypothetical protein
MCVHAAPWSGIGGLDDTQTAIRLQCNDVIIAISGQRFRQALDQKIPNFLDKIDATLAETPSLSYNCDTIVTFLTCYRHTGAGSAFGCRVATRRYSGRRLYQQL